MREYTHEANDIKTLIGQQIHAGYLRQEQSRELAESNDHKPLACYFCKDEIQPDENLNLHHPIYKSNGGTQVEPAHETCHVEFHSKQGDFSEWGKRSAETRAWAFNLKNVRSHPAYDFDRQYYLALYAH